MYTYLLFVYTSVEGERAPLYQPPVKKDKDHPEDIKPEPIRNDGDKKVPGGFSTKKRKSIAGLPTTTSADGPPPKSALSRSTSASSSRVSDSRPPSAEARNRPESSGRKHIVSRLQTPEPNAQQPTHAQTGPTHHHSQQINVKLKVRRRATVSAYPAPNTNTQNPQQTCIFCLREGRTDVKLVDRSTQTLAPRSAHSPAPRLVTRKAQSYAGISSVHNCSEETTTKPLRFKMSVMRRVSY